MGECEREMDLGGLVVGVGEIKRRGLGILGALGKRGNERGI